MLEPQRYFSSGGLAYHPNGEVMIEPLLGIGHDLQHRNISLFTQDSAHSITAQAGGRISILAGTYLAAAVKYPLYSFQSSGAPAAAAGTETMNPAGSNLTWTGEVGTSIGKGFRSFFYYDKINTPLTGGTPGRSEDRIGVRFQFNFK